MVKTILAICSLSLLASTAFANISAEAKDLKCVNATVKAVVMKNFKQTNAGTNSCGIKLLYKGEFKETYLVCTSDETEPTEYIAIMSPAKTGCKAVSIEDVNSGSTPGFEDENDPALLDSIECSVDFGDGKLICKSKKK